MHLDVLLHLAALEELLQCVVVYLVEAECVVEYLDYFVDRLDLRWLL